jgi:hypothetical protein
MPSKAVPETRDEQEVRVCWFPDGLVKTWHTEDTPDKSSVTCVVTVTDFAPVETSTEFGEMGTTPTSTGGVVSETCALPEAARATAMRIYNNGRNENLSLVLANIVNLLIRHGAAPIRGTETKRVYAR